MLVFLLWRWGLRGMKPPERAYARITRLGAMLGLGRPAHSTPSEYAGFLSKKVPSSADAITGIVARYEAQVYGRADIVDDQARVLEREWRRVRGAMVRWRLRNLVPGRAAPHDRTDDLVRESRQSGR